MGREGGRREEGGGKRSAAETAPGGPVAPADSGHRVLSSVRGPGRKSSPLLLDAHGPHSSRPPPGYRRGPHPTAPWSPEVGIALHKAEDPRAVPASWAPGPAPAPWREPRVTTAAATPNPALRCHSRLGLAFRQGVPRLCSSRALRVAERAPRQAAGMSHSRNPRMLTRPQPHPPRGPALRSAPTAPP